MRRRPRQRGRSAGRGRPSRARASRRQPELRGQRAGRGRRSRAWVTHEDTRQRSKTVGTSMVAGEAVYAICMDFAAGTRMHLARAGTQPAWRTRGGAAVRGGAEGNAGAGGVACCRTRGCAAGLLQTTEAQQGKSLRARQHRAHGGLANGGGRRAPQNFGEMV